MGNVLKIYNIHESNPKLMEYNKFLNNIAPGRSQSDPSMGMQCLADVLMSSGDMYLSYGWKTVDGEDYIMGSLSREPSTAEIIYRHNKLLESAGPPVEAHPPTSVHTDQEIPPGTSARLAEDYKAMAPAGMSFREWADKFGAGGRGWDRQR